MIATLDVEVLYVVSDLHLGGEAGFQIFRCAAEFAALVEVIAAEAATKRVALVINGDFVDLLAERRAACFDPDGASVKLARILGDEAFRPVVDGLRRLLSTDEVRVVVNLGNHDLELAMPWVAETLRERLAGDDPGPRARLALSLDGTGVRCAVGGAKVLCLHGNEVDAWNATDHEAIRKIARDLQRGIDVPPYVPNAGSKLVVDFMNDIKRRHPFVDALKPEVGAVLPMLAVIEPSAARGLRGAAAVLGRLVADGTRLRVGWLGQGDGDVAPPPAVVAAPPVDRAAAAAALLEAAEERHRSGVAASELLPEGAGGEALGLVAAVRGFAAGASPTETLRLALEGADLDAGYDPHIADDASRRIDARVDSSIDFLVVGHTHLRKDLPRAKGAGRYLNTGTWAALMRVPDDARRDPGAFGRYLERIRGTGLADLELAGLVMREPTVARIEATAGGARGSLRSVRTVAPFLFPVARARSARA